MAKIRHSTETDKILHNSNDKIVNLCGAPCDHCEDGTIRTTYRATIPFNTFSGLESCTDEFDGTTKDLTTGHPFYSAACARALDISELAGCDGLSPDAIVLTFLEFFVFLDFIFGGGTVRFSVPVTAPYDCYGPFVVTYETSIGSPPIDSQSGKSITITAIL